MHMDKKCTIYLLFPFVSSILLETAIITVHNTIAFDVHLYELISTYLQLIRVLNLFFQERVKPMQRIKGRILI